MEQRDILQYFEIFSYDIKIAYCLIMQSFKYSTSYYSPITSCLQFTNNKKYVNWWNYCEFLITIRKNSVLNYFYNLTQLRFWNQKFWSLWDLYHIYILFEITITKINHHFIIGTIALTNNYMWYIFPIVPIATSYAWLNAYFCFHMRILISSYLKFTVYSRYSKK